MGFSQIAQINNPDDRSYFDSDVNPGTYYCYRITGIYQNNNQYEPVEGYASVEVCAQLKQDIPLITNADVEKTDISIGKVFTAFTKPSELDTMVYPGPYKYELYRGSGFSGEANTFLKEFGPYPSFENLMNSADTTYLDSIFNTESQPNNYDIKLFFTNDDDQFEFVGNSRQNSTIFLEITPTHKSLILEWSANVLWKNEEYIVYREDRQNPDSFFVLDTITEASYKDTGLINGLTYCYYVKAKGKFQSDELPDSLINKSQITCEFPVDTFPPCPPTLEAVTECANFTNLLNWDYDFPCDSDIVSYNIYFRRHKGAEFSFVTNIDSAYIFSYRDSSDLLFESQAGCYVVAAVDSYDNQSRYSNQVCLDNCPLFELPNVFTPNGDNINDLYIPLASSRNIDSLNFKVFNRWGEMVFETSDPQINWDGSDQESGNPLNPGTYFYEATFFESYLERIIPKKQTGAITLIR